MKAGFLNKTNTGRMQPRMFMDGGDLLHAAENKNTGAQARAHELFSEGGIQYRLKAAMMRNDLGLMRALIVDGGADPNLPDSTCHRMKTAVHSACFMGAPEPALRLLVELGGNVKALDSTGRTPLHHAASGGRAELCRALVQAGCPINQKSQVYDTTAYEYALHYGHADVLRELARLGAQVTADQLKKDVAVCQGGNCTFNQWRAEQPKDGHMIIVDGPIP